MKKYSTLWWVKQWAGNIVLMLGVLTIGVWMVIRGDV